jgi:sugar phosphate isomerase/epimerase
MERDTSVTSDRTTLSTPPVPSGRGATGKRGDGGDRRSILHGSFVNLPLRFVADDRRYIELFLERGLQPELGLDAWALDHLPVSWHEEVSGLIRSSGLGCSVHLPFFDLQPGSQDGMILAATRERLSSSLECAGIYRPSHLIGHIGYDPLLYRLNREEWEKRSLRTWSALLDEWPGHPPLFLENVHESDPQWVGRFLARLAPRKVGLCLDIGHWHSFGKGARLGNLRSWLDLLGSFPAHLHLHDNHGEDDEHLGLGSGSIPLITFLESVNGLGIRPGVTFEPHSREDLERTAAFVGTNFALFSFLT